MFTFGSEARTAGSLRGVFFNFKWRVFETAFKLTFTFLKENKFSDMSEKSLLFTYFLWLFGGIFGLHHFYLNRDYHALVWWMFVGGYFGAGWFRDLWRIPEYVKDANEEPSYIAELAQFMKKNDKPPTGYFRYFGQMVVADTFGFLILNAFPKEMLTIRVLQFIAAITVPLACSLGITILFILTLSI